MKKNSHPSIEFCCDDLDEEKNARIKTSIVDYFTRGDEIIRDVQVDQTYLSPDAEDSVRSHIKDLISSESDQSWTGRSVARILHGISSPNFPAKVWGRVRRFWRALLHMDFNLLVNLANAEIISCRR